MDGGAITTLGAFRTFTNIPGPGVRTAYFAAFGSRSRVLPKNAESLRDSDALMRVAVPRCRGPAGLRDLFVSDEITVFTPCAQGFPRVRGMGGITTLGLFHTFRKPCVAGCQNGVLCRFGILAGRCSRRTQKAFGTAMRLCVSLSRGVAAPLGCVIFSVSVEIAARMPCAQGLSVCARRGVVSLPSARFTCY